MRIALIAVRVGEELELDERTLEDVFYVSLLQYVGCTAESHLDARFWGDEVAARGEMVPALLGSQAGLFATAVRSLHAESEPLRRTGEVLRRVPGMRETLSAWADSHCEVSVMLAERLALRLGVKEALAHLYERWDGKGFPGRLRWEEVPLPVRVMQVAHDADLHSGAGVEGASEVVRRRAERGLDPAVAAVFVRTPWQALAVLEAPSIWEALLVAEPGRRRLLERREFDLGLRAIADFTDMKSPYLSGHSAGVAGLAAEAAVQAGWRSPSRRWSGVPVSFTIWAGSGCRPGSGASRARSPETSSSASASTPTTPSGCWPRRRRLPRSRGLPPCTTSGWTAPATTVACAAASSRRSPASWLLPTPTTR